MEPELIGNTNINFLVLTVYHSHVDIITGASSLLVFSQSSESNYFKVSYCKNEEIKNYYYIHNCI